DGADGAQPAVRLRLDRGGQCPHRGTAMGENARGGGDRGRGVGQVMAPRTTPPFRADHVGSLLRPAPLKEARAKHARKEITDAQLREVEDREIEKAIRKQEEIGLKLATDGEFRRSWWQFDFYKSLDNVELYTVGEGIQFA